MPITATFQVRRGSTTPEWTPGTPRRRRVGKTQAAGLAAPPTTPSRSHRDESARTGQPRRAPRRTGYVLDVSPQAATEDGPFR